MLALATSINNTSPICARPSARRPARQPSYRAGDAAAGARGGRGVPHCLPAASAVGQLPVRRRQLRHLMARRACVPGCAHCAHYCCMQPCLLVKCSIVVWAPPSGLHRIHSELGAITSAWDGGKTGGHAARESSAQNWQAAQEKQHAGDRHESVQNWNSLGGLIFSGRRQMRGALRGAPHSRCHVVGVHAVDHAPLASKSLSQAAGNGGQAVLRRLARH